MTNAEIRTRLVELGQHVRRARLAARLSQRELDRRSHVGYRFISELELGKENPSLATLMRIADGLGCDLAVLLVLGKSK